MSDLTDARAYIRLGKVDSDRLLTLFAEIEPSLIRYPAIDPILFRSSAEQFAEAYDRA